MPRTDPAVRSKADMLSRPGPHAVSRGDLAAAGIPGVLFTPRSGHGLPAVAFGHGWLQPTARYEELLRHLATWGVVAAAPATQRGALASHQQFATDLRTTLDVCARARLGAGEVSVDPGKLGLVGHGMGGGCAVLAAAEDDRCAAVATLAVAETLPSALPAARGCAMPGLHVTGGKDLLAPKLGHAEQVARAWAGPVLLRTLPKASHLGFTAGPHWSDLLLGSGPETGTRRMSRALITAFLLRHLTGATGTEATEYDALLTDT
ncbi:MAG: dienelactone hydrolase family protein [Pseudonocardiaceae bacterium]